VSAEVVIHRSLIICFVPRSGSTFLAGLLTSTGLAGKPFEFFATTFEEERKAQGLETDEEHIESVRRQGVTANATFGCKLTYPELQDLVGRLRRIDGGVRGDVPLIASAFPAPVFVWMRRRDVVAQAVSWARALQTQQWHATERAVRAPDFDFDVIHRCVARIPREEAAWMDWFSSNGVGAAQVFYEEVLADPRSEVARVVRLLGLELPPDAEVEPPRGFERQGDELNEEWANRYRARLLENRDRPRSRTKGRATRRSARAARVEPPDFQANAFAACESVRGWLSRSEAWLLFDVAASLPDDGPLCCVLGSSLDQSTVVLGLALEGKPGSVVYAVDPLAPRAEQSSGGDAESDALTLLTENVRQFGFDGMVRPIRGRSSEVARAFRERLDLLVLRADRGYEAARDDFDAWARLVKRDGFVAFHGSEPQDPAAAASRVVDESIRGNEAWFGHGHVGRLFVARKRTRRERLRRMLARRLRRTRPLRRRATTP
jgi:LPS sulfotransferase NodH